MLRRSFLQTAILSPAVFGQNPPARHWHVYVFNSSHLDLGFQDLPPVIIERELTFLEQTIDLCDATAHAAPEVRYKATVEHAVLIDFFERTRGARQLERLFDCIRRGQIEVGAIYTGVHTDLCGHEELARLIAYAASLRRRFGLPVSAAMLNDASEGYTMGLAQVLARSGIRYFCMGQGAKANIKGIEAELPRIFNWGGEDGSRVLVAWTPGLWTYSRYGAAGYHGHKTLAEFEHLPDYPYDVMFRQGGKGDISSPDPKMLDLIASYRQQTPEAEISLATVREFFEALEKRYANQIPKISGDRANSWADGPISLARETGIHWRTQAQLAGAEILMTLAGRDERGAVRDAYRNLHLYSDHTWGSDFDPDARPGHIRKFYHDIAEGKRTTVVIPPGETLGPDSPQMKEFEKSWDAKKAYAYQARDLTGGIRDRALGALNASLAGSAPRVAVWNTLSWARTDIACFDVPAGAGEILRLRNIETGAYAAIQRDPSRSSSRWCFLAGPVPAFGCSVYEVETGAAEKIAPVPGVSIENEFYRLRLNPHTGALDSLFDRERNFELVDSSASYGVGQYIHDNVNDFYEGTGGSGKSGFAYGAGQRYVPRVDQAPVIESGPVFSVIRVLTKLDEGPAPAQLVQEAILYRSLKYVVLRNRVTKKAAMEKEQIYVAFPFETGGNPQFELELAYSVLRWPGDILPGTWRGYDTVRNWVRVSGQRAAITWTSLDAPVVCAGGITSNHWDPQWHRTYVPTNSHLYSYVMSNIWNCNYPLWQGGAMDFDYAITSNEPVASPAESVRFGWSSHLPLEARWVPAGPPGAAWKPEAGIEIQPANVIASALKPAEDGRGVILRLFETAGTRTSARVRVRLGSHAKARRANLVEEDLETLAFQDGWVRVDLNPRELATLRFENS